MRQNRPAAPITSPRFSSVQNQANPTIKALCWLLSAALAAQAQTSAIEISVVEGNGERYPAGSRAYRGVTVEVVDEQGAPVPRARVVFRMPESGPGGTFVSGAAEEVSFTDSRGRTSAWGIQWNRIPGECRISIFVSAGKARAGTTASILLTGDAPPAVEPPKPAAAAAAPAQSEVQAPPKPRVRLTPKPEDTTSAEPAPKRPGVVLSRNERLENPVPSPRSKWILIAAGIGGAIGAGVYWNMARQKTVSAPGGPAPSAVINPPAARAAIGNPTITIGRP